MSELTAKIADQRAGIIFGAFTADALALGAHWIYDQEKLKNEFGRVTEFLQPRADSYHSKKKAGEQSHYGDQALVLLGSLADKRPFDLHDFAQRWQQSWINYPDYFDHATKETLANLQNGIAIEEAASDSEELGGAARLAPLLASMIGQPLDEMIAAARAQTRLTHGSRMALDAAEFWTRVVFSVVNGAAISDAIENATNVPYKALPAAEILAKVKVLSSFEISRAVDELGQACPAIQAVPSCIAILLRYPEELENAFVENVMAGGDSAARALTIGMVLGASLGRLAIPQRWMESLQSKPQVETFLQNLSD